MIRRHVVVVVPAHNEADHIANCLQRLLALSTDDRVDRLGVIVLANNCDDATVAIVEEMSRRTARSLSVKTVRLEPERAHAGWARRLAWEAGALCLAEPQDLLMCTDADTWVARDWLVRTLDHFDAGYDAVAGFARLNPVELRKLDLDHRRRLATIRRYEDARSYLEALRPGLEPTPRHSYEGGASIAVTLAAFKTLHDVPTPRVGEDKALFDALRAQGRRIRHPKDVRVMTSCRLKGRAPDGTADTLARWGAMDQKEALGLPPLTGVPGASRKPSQITWSSLESETRRARALIAALRSERDLAEAS